MNINDLLGSANLSVTPTRKTDAQQPRQAPAGTTEATTRRSEQLSLSAPINRERINQLMTQVADVDNVKIQEVARSIGESRYRVDTVSAAENILRQETGFALRGKTPGD